ncbi:CPBP family intramembrane glutamic endopeptidase [Actinomadura bangladeshensis]|uniref:CPBP family intramembrane metalloprotease n=1 Tax=Actinomadura bangladeshensis TaxID=453573 RepID=A0A6L9Q9R9_9ACTN|nr:CPBP family intramembrane glutamic endopeptidase [Actinomadura bangladeshensis]NEA22240.1 CPBP family intramembrane metalloprotease [Actinomadura bangladeshensis]
MKLLIQLLAVGAVAAAGGAATQAVKWDPLPTLGLGLASAVLALFVYAFVVGRTERRQVDELAREGALPALGRGALIGLAMFGAVIANLAFLGDYEVDGFGSLTGPIALVGFMAAAAVTEELLFRGVLFRIIEKRIGTWWSLALTGLVFGLMHLGNENATFWGAIAIAIEAGGMLAAAYAATRTLWVPIGLHFAWNFAGAGIFGTAVSGSESPDGLLKGATSGPELISGGEFGPEASLYSVGFGLVVTAAFLWLAHRRGTLVPRRRRDRPAAPASLAQ